MKNVILHALLLSLILCACTQSGVTGSNSRGEDSIYSAEYINRICRTQPRHALGLLDTAEQRNMLSPADINGMRAMVYNDGLGMRNVAIIYIRKTYELPEVKKDTTLLIKTLRMLAALNYTVSQYSELLKYATEGLDIAGKRGDLAAQAYFMQFVGFGKVKTESLDAGLEYIDRGNNIFSDIAHKKASWKEADDMLYGYMQKINLLIEHLRFSEAIKLMTMCEEAYGLMLRAPDLAEGVAELRKAEVLALYTAAYIGAGDKRKAAEYYQKLIATECVKSGQGSDLVIAYLMGTKQYDEVLKCIAKEKARLAEVGDTLSDYYLNSVLTYEQMCFEGKGDKDKALSISKQIKTLTDSLFHRENVSYIAELSSIYNAKDMELQLVVQKEIMARHRIIFIVAVVLLLILSVFVAVLFRYSRHVTRRNKISASIIKELTDAHHKERQMKIREPVQADANEDGIDSDRAEFDRIDNLIVGQQLFLQVGFSREEAAGVANISQKRFSSLFQTFANGFPNYVNNLRLEYSITLLRSKPNYTIEAVSYECGFSSRQTFHRLFVEKYGMTPSEFKKTVAEQKS